MEARISGQRGIALIRADDDKFFLLQAAIPRSILPLATHEAVTLLHDAQDVEFVAVHSIADVDIHLQRAFHRERSLQLFLLCLDDRLLKKFRKTLILHLEELLSLRGVRALLEGVLYCAPLPPTADRSGMSTLAIANAATRTATVIGTLLRSQDAIRRMYTLWGDIPTTVFGTRRVRERCTTAAAFNGYFRTVLCGDDHDVEAVISATVESVRLEFDGEFCATLTELLRSFARICAEQARDSPSNALKEDPDERTDAAVRLWDDWHAAESALPAANRTRDETAPGAAIPESLRTLVRSSGDGLTARLEEVVRTVDLHPCPPLAAAAPLRTDLPADVRRLVARLRMELPRLLEAWDPERDAPNHLLNLLELSRAVRATDAEPPLTRLVLEKLPGHAQESTLRWHCLNTLAEAGVYDTRLFERFIVDPTTASLCFAALCRHDVQAAPLFLPIAAKAVGSMRNLAPTISNLCFSTFSVEGRATFLDALLIKTDLDVLPELAILLSDLGITVDCLPLNRDAELGLFHKQTKSSHLIARLSTPTLDRIPALRVLNPLLEPGAIVSLDDVLDEVERKVAASGGSPPW